MNVAAVECINTEKLHVFTLGSFDVKRNGQSLTHSSNRSYRLWELLKHVLTFRDQPVYVETLIGHLWSEKECTDPYNALKTQMYRLRKILGQHPASEEQYLLFCNSSYKWNTEANYWMDVEVFEESAARGKLAQENGDMESALEHLLIAADLYKGRYMNDSPMCEWLVSARNYYHRIYIDAITDLTEILMDARCYEELVGICERAFAVEFYEELWHQRYIEALLLLNKQRSARAHYDNVVSTFEREMGVSPSPELKALSKKMLGERTAARRDLASIIRSIEDEDKAEGAFICEPSSFSRLYELEMRRYSRNGQSSFLGMICIDGNGEDDSRASAGANRSEQIAASIIKGLRKGDLVTEWRESQFLVLLPGLNYEQADKVIARLTARIDAAPGDLRCELLPLQILDLEESLQQAAPPVQVADISA